MDRRGFLRKTSLVGLLGLQILPSRILGMQGVSPSNKINMAIIGNGLISEEHRRYFSAAAQTQVVALCDVHQGRLQSAKKQAEEITKRRADTGFNQSTLRPIPGRFGADEHRRRVVARRHWHVAIALKA